ncbi:MAG: hypothetical protein Q9170_004148 [Blastenia crenularia]
MYIARCCIFTVLFAWLRAVLSSPLLLKTPPGLSASRSLDVVGFDEDKFEVVLQSRLPDVPLDEDAVFINTVEAMREIALGNYAGSMPLWRFTTATYPEVVIVLDTPLHINIPRTYAIWGLPNAFADMSRSHAFAVSSYNLFYDEEIVGTISFRYRRPIVDKHANSTAVVSKRATDVPEYLDQTTDDLERRSNAPVPAEILQAPNPTNEPRLRVEFTYGAEPMHKEDMMLSIIYSLLLAAPPPSDAEVPTEHPFSTPNFSFHCVFVAWPIHRTAPPFLMWFWLIDAIAEAAGYIVDQNEYRMLEMDILVDSVAVAKAVLKPLQW